MANYRQGRVNEEMRKELSEILRTVKDPRVTTAFVSITAVDCSADLKFAKVFFSVMGERRNGDAGKGLENASGYIRTQLARNLNLRITPELKFICDDSMKRGAQITELLKQVEKELDEKDRLAESQENNGKAMEENNDADK
ncbi:MAG: 30S ribosome-binding factor RbfA [Clostridia bacterium]|nr:30S ribosome-binding factor RbfA [Clostridia bacterium]